MAMAGASFRVLLLQVTNGHTPVITHMEAEIRVSDRRINAEAAIERYKNWYSVGVQDMPRKLLCITK